MITCQIMGGLGNQLFQIFTLLAYGLQNNTQIVFPYYDNFMERNTYWNSFLKNFALFTTKNPSNNLTNDQLVRFPRYSEQGFRYQQLPNFGEANVFLSGYFQSYKYFESKKNIISSIIQLDTFKSEIVEEFPDLFISDSENEKMTTVSMHFRMGDYKTKAEYHPIMPYKYYENAMRTILDKLSDEDKKEVRVLFFCEHDDNPSVFIKIDQLVSTFETLYNDSFSIEFVKVGDGIEDWKQMLIMACCDHHIIANSTFSWWGAYLNDFEEKIVCWPSLWFGIGYAHYKMDDLCPPEWIKIIVEEADKVIV